MNKEDEKKVFGYLGLARRAGRLAAGEMMAEETIRKGKAKFVLIAADASLNTRSKFHRMCSTHGVRCVEYADRSSLGHATGTEYRSVCVLTDAGFSEAVARFFSSEESKEIVDGKNQGS